MTEWPVASLGEMVDCLDTLRRPVRAADRRPGIYPYYGASGIIDHVDGFLFDGTYTLVAEDGENLRSRKTPIAFLARGRFWVNNHAHVLSGTPRSDVRFLAHRLQHSDVAGYLTGSTQPKLTQHALLSMKFRWPTLDEQHAIASILGALDDKIDVDRHLIHVLQGLIRLSFEQQFCNPEIAAMADWPEGTIGESVSVFGGSTPRTSNTEYWEDGTIAWATPKDLSRLSSSVLFDTQRHITESGLHQISSGLLPAGTVLLSSRAPIGYLAIAEVPVAINQGFIALVCDKSLPNLYVWQWIYNHLEDIKARANGTTFLEISKANFRPLTILLPPEDLVNVWYQAAQPMYESLVNAEREIEVLWALREALLPKLLNGELRVRDAESLVKEAI